MKKLIIIASLLLLILSSCKQKKTENNHIQTKQLTRTEIIEKKLKKAYPDFILGIKDNQLMWTDSTAMIFDDNILNKSFDTLLNYPDIEEQFYYEYPMESNYQDILDLNYDPGRIRNDVFLKKMYGSTEDEVKQNLVEIIWLPSTDSSMLLVTRINGVHKKLEQISQELDSLPDELKKFIVNPAGTFKWRVISGTRRLSAHSFGIAIDINIEYSNYWKWDIDSKKKPKYKNKIPLQIVKIFEKYGFIWGGKWYHYDTMHFEYRPELID